MSVKIVEFIGEKRLLAVAKDITERKDAEDKLKEKIEQLEKYKKVTIGRELKMVELKKQIKELESKCLNKNGGE